MTSTKVKIEVERIKFFKSFSETRHNMLGCLDALGRFCVYGSDFDDQRFSYDI
jgi:hypothetical protein